MSRKSWAKTALRMAAGSSFIMLLAACGDTPTAPLQLRGPRMNVTASGEKYLFMDTPSDQIAADVPTFGGAFISDGKLNVYLTPGGIGNQAAEDAAREVIARVLASNGRQGMLVHFIPGAFSFIQLRTWETTLRNEYRQIGVHTAGIDERTNRLSIVVPTVIALNALDARVVSNAIPAQAISRSVGPEGEAFTLLTDKVRPTRGGLAIEADFNYMMVNYSFGCTYGFNAQIQGSSTRYMITNAHCVEPTNVFGGLIGATIKQNASGFLTNVGSVVSNPASFTGTGCAAGDHCRLSDAVLVSTTGLLSADWDLGGISRTTTRGTGPGSSGSLTINATTPRIALAGSSTFFAGDTLEKIGQTTGWTAGVVTGTCVYHVDVHFGRVCDGVVAAGANHGDSGSPVFWKSGAASYFLMGILWGGAGAVQGGANSTEFWFSRFGNIKSDLSPLANLIVN